MLAYPAIIGQVGSADGCYAIKTTKTEKGIKTMVKVSNVELNGIQLEETETWVNLGRDTTNMRKETIGSNHTWIMEGGPEESVVRFDAVEGSSEAGQLRALHKAQADLSCSMDIDGERVVLGDGVFIGQPNHGGSSFVGKFIQED